MPELKLSGAGIVLRGSFNPPILQPAWLAANGLMSDEESAATEIEIIHREIVAFSSESYSLQVTSDTFQVDTAKGPSFSILRDLIVGCFTLLNQTPITAMGLNRNAHFLMSSDDAWHALGHRLVPPESWEKLLEKPGMASLTIQAVRPDKNQGFIRVTVEPSVKFYPGVYVGVNDHYQLEETLTADSSYKMLEILKESWDDSMQRTEALIKKVVEDQV